jgi:TRAP-type C4-dicarboxylate transport system permease small subunit
MPPSIIIQRTDNIQFIPVLLSIIFYLIPICIILLVLYFIFVIVKRYFSKIQKKKMKKNDIIFDKYNILK